MKAAALARIAAAQDKRLALVVVTRLADGAQHFAAPETAAKARLLFEGDLAHCCPVDAKNWQTSRSFLTRLLEKAAYLLVARIDPHFTSLRWRTLVRKAFEPGVEASKKTRRSPYLPPFSG